MVDIVVRSVVAREVLKWVKRKSISTVVVNRLDGSAGEEPHGLSARHTSHEIRNTGSESVEQKSLERVVVQRSVCIWNVQAVVSGVNLGWIMSV